MEGIVLGGMTGGNCQGGNWQGELSQGGLAAREMPWNHILNTVPYQYILIRITVRYCVRVSEYFDSYVDALVAITTNNFRRK